MMGSNKHNFLRLLVLWPLTVLMAFWFNTGRAAESAGQEPHVFVVSGVLVNSGNGRAIADFVGYLSRRADYPMRAVFVDSYRQLSIILRDKPDAVGWNCGAPYVEDQKEYGQQLIAVPLFQGRPLYHSLILSRSGGAEQRLLDFRDRVFVYSDPRSNSGYLAPSYALLQAGETMDDFFRLRIHTASHEKSIEALLGGLGDVAAVDEYVWVSFLRMHPQAADRLSELERMGPFPFTPIVAGVGVTEERRRRMTQALLSMDSDAQGRRLLAGFGLDGFVEVDVAFFEPIADMLKAVSGQKADRTIEP